jgi:2-hydroxychromene-2-carboxylate isomerase
MPTLFFDLGSPYSYLAAERAESVLGVRPHLHPTLLGPIFALRGWGSWGHTPQRAEHLREIEQRAERYGVPPIVWPSGWPPNTLQAMRATVWAGTLGAGDAYARAAFRAAFAEGADLGDVAVLQDIAARVNLPAAELPDALTNPTIKTTLRTLTQQAIDLGVRGAPTLQTDTGALIFGDDRLAEGATAPAPPPR